MSEPETVFKLKALDTGAPANYLLSVYMPVPFGMGKNVFLVDYLDYDSDTRMFTGTRKKKRKFSLAGPEVVVSFPDTFQYMLVGREQYEIISMEEAKKALAEAEDEEKESAPPVSHSQYL